VSGVGSVWWWVGPMLGEGVGKVVGGQAVVVVAWCRQGGRWGVGVVRWGVSRRVCSCSVRGWQAGGHSRQRWGRWWHGKV